MSLWLQDIITFFAWKWHTYVRIPYLRIRYNVEPVPYGENVWCKANGSEIYSYRCLSTRVKRNTLKEKRCTSNLH